MLSYLALRSVNILAGIFMIYKLVSVPSCSPSCDIVVVFTESCRSLMTSYTYTWYLHDNNHSMIPSCSQVFDYLDHNL